MLLGNIFIFARLSLDLIFRCSVPSDRRAILWKVLLGVHALYPNNQEYVWKWRTKPYYDVVRALKVMGKIRDTWPPAKNLTVTYLLMEKMLIVGQPVEKQLKQSKAANFMAIAQAMTQIFESEVEAFWIARGLNHTIQRLKEEEQMLTDLEKVYHKIMASYNGKLYSHLEEIGLNHDLPLRKWLLQGFAGVLYAHALQKVWDKVVGGSLVVLVYVAVSIVDTAKNTLLGLQTSKEALKCLESVSYFFIFTLL